MSTSRKESITLADMPPEILSPICEFLLPDRSLDRPRRVVHQDYTVIDGLKWTESLPYGVYCRMDMPPSSCVGPTNLGPESIVVRSAPQHAPGFDEILISRPVQQPDIFNDLANFARTCKWVANAACGIRRTHRYLLTIAHNEIAFEGVRCAEPDCAYMHRETKRWVMVDDSDRNERLVSEIPKAQLPRNVAFRHLTSMFSKIKHLAIIIDLDLSGIYHLSYRRHKFDIDAETKRLSKAQLYCDRIGDWLGANTARLLDCPSVEIVAKVSLAKIVNARAASGQTSSHSPEHLLPSYIGGLFFSEHNNTKTMAEFLALHARNTLKNLIVSLVPFRKVLNMKVVIDGSHKSNNWNGTGTAVSMSGRSILIEFGGFEVFCGTLQRELLGENTLKAENVVDNEAKLCEMGLPVLIGPRPNE
ncbi:hypothetical protein PV08_02785 [Exophiala spinifera]|uniref:F-box domain-containing protein n=1 Tax=Exophiala spinifera TaxID=91928 RepID=A0A0D2A0K7_9EURO|nr:uncharacterized protein PV08_02785 [Exophiala spinifera]KIW18497.1 hypothetical protein PV08_02785 [Exophiala spinifera]